MCYQPNPMDQLNIVRTDSQYSVGGNISGLSGTVYLENNNTNQQAFNSDGSYTFSNQLNNRQPYRVSVATQPSGQTCMVSNGTGTMGSSNITNVDVTCSNNNTTLKVSVDNLVLSVTGYNEYGIGNGQVVSGIPREIIITNDGSATAKNVTYSLSASLPNDAKITSTCNSISPNNTCKLTITPGATPSAAVGDLYATPIILSIAGSNTDTVKTNLSILAYGSYYQGGYVYAFDDTSPLDASVGGKVVTTTDQAEAYPNGIIWSSNGNSESESKDIIPWIAEDNDFNSSYSYAKTIFDSTYSNTENFPFPPADKFIDCNGATDGKCNTSNILVLYNTYNTNYNNGNELATGTTAPSYYAASKCTEKINDYTDWYLPAICEMGHDSKSGCGTQDSPTLQNIQKSLREIVGWSEPNGYYWSSTEYSSAPQAAAWCQIFGSNQANCGKELRLDVRCSRTFTP